MKNDNIDKAYSHCLSIVRTHYENFPVASMVLPPDMRRHIAAVYAIARMGDDTADELIPLVSQNDRLSDLKLLDDIVDGVDPEGNPVFIAVQHTISEKHISPDLFHRLFEAFRRDIIGTGHKDPSLWHMALATWNDVLDYCHYSANPVGELVLAIAGETSLKAVTCSNDICTALQITNFLQDIEYDQSRGRNYVPLSIDETIDRTRTLFLSGREIIHYVNNWRLRLELRAIIAGGMTMLQKTQKLRNSEARKLRNSEARKLRNSEAQKLRNSEAQKLRNSETQKPRNSETQKPRNSETQKPRKSRSVQLNVWDIPSLVFNMIF